MMPRMLVDARASLRDAVARTARGRIARVGAFSASTRLSIDRVALEHGRLLELAADAQRGDLGLVEAWSGR